MNWIRPKTITGSPAEGDCYLRRQYINDEFWEKIRNNEHILFVAPRRVGKSSVMKDLENSPEGCVALYQNIESDRNQQEFFKRIFLLLLDRLQGHTRFIKRVGQWIKQRGIGEISAEGIKFESKELSYKDELLRLIEELGKEEDLRIVMMLDEFPDVIQAIAKNDGHEAAIETLRTLRKIRHDKEFKQFSFVFAGSVGLHHVVATLDRESLINDLAPVRIDKLSGPEAHELLSLLLDGATMQMGSQERDYLLDKITYLLPYHIQLMVEKCDAVLYPTKTTVITRQDIDKAFNEVIKEGRNFNDWETRLTRYLGKEDSKYCIEILTRTAHKEGYTIQDAFNHSKRTVPVTGYKALLDDILIKDGYLAEEKGRYFFLSPFLREWWKNRHPEFEIED